MERNDALRKAGKITYSALKKGIDLIISGERDGVKIADAIEDTIVEKGARWAFPCNIGPDNIAAHYSPDETEPMDLSSASVVKLDAGAHIDGWIADAAVSFALDEDYLPLVRAAADALAIAVEAIRPGVPVSEVGKMISAVAKEAGYKPISNLGGHQIEQYNLHAGLFVPNVPEGNAVLEEGMIVAIEPFITNGDGRVHDGSTANIFSLIRPRARSPVAKKVVDYIQRNYGPLPFSQKWLLREFGQSARIALLELYRVGAIHAYPVLLERKGSVVAQFETTVIVEPDGAEPIVDTFSIAEEVLR